MICPRCQKKIARDAARCPHCGEANPQGSGLFQTSTVLISADGAEMVYRSVDEVPAGLRTRLLKSTNGNNSATILIADRRGRKEIARAMRKLPGPAQRRGVHSALSAPAEAGWRVWLKQRRRNLLWVALPPLAALAVWLLGRHWPVWP
ncbi:MAG TPA: hypothetical protein VML19_12445 [Verrucomicrobiae bacterium]|nr:hypothetical protein [Verrucomicrobiae bacterium]